MLTADAVTLNPALVAPAGTFTEAGTCNALVLLTSFTTVCVVAEALIFTEHALVVGPVSVSVPHESLLIVGPAVGAGYSVITSVLDTVPAFAVIVTLTDLVTAAATAVKPPVFAPAATTTEVGTLRAALLLVSDTVMGFVDDAVRYTEQPFVCAPVNDPVPQETMLSAAEVVVVELASTELGLRVIPPQPDKAKTIHPDSSTHALLRMRSLIEGNESGNEFEESNERIST